MQSHWEATEEVVHSVIRGNMIVGALVDQYPDARDVLVAYGVEFIDDDEELPLAELAELYSLDVDDVIADIESALRGEDWGGEEDWDDDEDTDER